MMNSADGICGDSNMCRAVFRRFLAQGGPKNGVRSNHRTIFQRSDSYIRTLLHPSPQPGHRKCPVFANGPGRQSQHFGDLIAGWGTDNPLLDINGDGIVGIEDLLFLLWQQGPCP